MTKYKAVKTFSTGNVSMFAGEIREVADDDVFVEEYAQLADDGYIVVYEEATHVEANNAEATTETLTKLKVGDENYAVPQGGGSGSSGGSKVMTTLGDLFGFDMEYFTLDDLDSVQANVDYQGILDYVVSNFHDTLPDESSLNIFVGRVIEVDVEAGELSGDIYIEAYKENGVWTIENATHNFPSLLDSDGVLSSSINQKLYTPIPNFMKIIVNDPRLEIDPEYCEFILLASAETDNILSPYLSVTIE